MTDELARRVVEAAHLELPQDWTLSGFGAELELILGQFQIDDYRARVPTGKGALLHVQGLRGHIDGLRAALISANDGIPQDETERAIMDLRSRIIARVNLTNGNGSNWFEQLMGSLDLLDSVLASMEPNQHETERDKAFAEHSKTIEQWQRWIKVDALSGEISTAEAEKVLAKVWLQRRRAPKSDANREALRAMMRNLRDLWANVFGSKPGVSPPAALRATASDHVAPGQRFPLLVVAMADEAGCDRGIVPGTPDALRKEIERALAEPEANQSEMDGLDR